MKTALIPPIPELREFAVGPIHLLLSHLCEDPKYVRHYRERALLGEYLIVDNSAHEFRQGQSVGRLLDYAQTLGAKEIVLTDELFSCQGTIAATTLALDYLGTYGRERVAPLRLHYMMVPQGNSIEDYQRCLDGLMTAYSYAQERHPEVFTFPPVIGISKDYESLSGGLYEILERLVVPLIALDDIQIHMLGWGRQLNKLSAIGKDFGGMIRSIDSAKPFVFAHSGIKLTVGQDAMYPCRPLNYFQIRLSDHARQVSSQNISVFKTLAGDR